MQIEVIHALKDKVHVKKIDVAEGSTIHDAIRQSGILEECTEIDLTVNKVGIFSQLRELDTMVKDGDRVEIYRPLIADPRESRRKRAGS